MQTHDLSTRHSVQRRPTAFCVYTVHQLQLSLTLVGASTSWVEASLYTPAPKSSNLPSIAFWEPNLPTKARNCNFRHFRDIICVSGTYQ